MKKRSTVKMIYLPIKASKIPQLFLVKRQTKKKLDIKEGQATQFLTLIKTLRINFQMALEAPRGSKIMEVREKGVPKIDNLS